MNPTPEHREQAQAMIALWINKLDKVDSRLPPLLIDAVTAALSSRDTEIREVLEGLVTHQIGSRRPCWCPLDYGSEPHTELCDAARALYAKLQRGEESLTG